MSKFMVVRKVPGARNLIGDNRFDDIPVGTILESRHKNGCIYYNDDAVCDIGSIWEEKYLRRCQTGSKYEIGQVVRPNKGWWRGLAGIVVRVHRLGYPDCGVGEKEQLYTVAMKHPSYSDIPVTDVVYTESSLEVDDGGWMSRYDDIMEKSYARHNSIVEKLVEEVNKEEGHWKHRMLLSTYVINHYAYKMEMDGDEWSIWGVKSGDHTLYITMGDTEWRATPHFHIFPSMYTLRMWRGGTSLMLLKDSYFLYGYNRLQLSDDDLEAINKWLQQLSNRSEYIGHVKQNNWNMLIDMWNVYHPGRHIYGASNWPISYSTYRSCGKYPEVYEE